jgi:ATP/maltotriose-dependent transcriptional regulator MalT
VDTLKLDAALEELRTKSLCDIHRETAIKWAWRSWAATVLGLLIDREEYKHEAIEHAALAGNLQTLAKVRLLCGRGYADGGEQEALNQALAELGKKTLAQIQRETALLWAYRALAAYQLERVADAVDYEQEALEHAALSGSDDMFREVQALLGNL